ncbi:amidohydrolase family protein [Kineococcus sp. SYSU DK004]|uniref:amidohydrolase family protein n=1 Tax=Kineococcus sp. SYSU DK004 TaxID=3383125 RepID=UPI003D7D5715
MTAVDLVLRATRAVVDGAERACSIGVRDGRVTGVEAYGVAWDAAREDVLGEDEVLLPGLVDVHARVSGPGRSDLVAVTRAAAAGGTTTLLDTAAGGFPPVLDPVALAVRRAAALDRVAVDVGSWGAVAPGGAGSLLPLHEAGVFGAECALRLPDADAWPAPAPVTGGPAPLDAGELAAVAGQLARVDGLLLVHLPGAAAADRPDAPAGSDGSDGEAALVRAVADAAALTGVRAHVAPVTSAAGVAEVARARTAGVRLTAGTRPGDLALDAPHRRADREALWAGLLAGTVDAVSSGPAPGAPGAVRAEALRSRLPLVWTLARARGVPLAAVAGWTATRPAALAGLEDRGRLAEGALADAVVLAPDEETGPPAGPSAPRDAALTGAVRRTLLRGRVVAERPRGRLLRAPARVTG